MKLSCVKIECPDCNTEDYLSSGAFIRSTEKILTDNTAALIPQTLGCRNCSSNNINVFHANKDGKSIVKEHKTTKCKYCNNNIPESFFTSFPGADFCPLCVSKKLLSDNDILAASTGDYKGDTYNAMSMQFHDSFEDRVFWLKKALHAGYTHAGITLGDLLSKSDNKDDLTEAYNFYKMAASESKLNHLYKLFDNIDNDTSLDGLSAEYRLAIMIFKGLGVKANKKEAMNIMLSLADNRHYLALNELGDIFMNGKYGIDEDHNKAFEFYSKSYNEASFRSRSSSATVALMLLSGVGTKADKNKGSDILKDAISIYGEHKNFDQESCFNEILKIINDSYDNNTDLPNARIYLNWMVKINVPLAQDLLKCCGGPIPDKKPIWELSLKSVIPRGVKGVSILDVSVPSSKDYFSQPKILGQIEEISSQKWMVTTDDSEMIGGTFKSEKEAVQALANVTNCDAEYIDSKTKIKRVMDKFLKKA